MQNKIKEGENLFAAGDLEQAELCFLEVLESDPEYSEALNNLGVIQLARGNPSKAEDYFLKALAAQGDNMDALINLADVYQTAERWPDAAEQLEKGILIDERNVHLFNRLAMLYLEMGKLSKARIHLEKSLAIDPDQDIARESLEALPKEVKTTVSEPATYRAAFMEVDITPDVSDERPAILQGYSGPARMASTVSVPLKMQLLLLEDAHFTRLLFVTADLFGFGPEIVDPVRAVAAKWGIEPEGILLNASHTHYAPGTISHASKELGLYDGIYTKQISEIITSQLPNLYENLEPCRISRGEAEARIGVNRRLPSDGKILNAPNEDGFYMDHTPFLMIHRVEHDDKVLLLNHGCHPTGLDLESTLSADFPAFTRNALIRGGSAEAVMFLQGAAGSTKEAMEKEGKIRFCDCLQKIKENGEILAGRIGEALENGLHPVKGAFFCIQESFTLPLNALPPTSDIEAIRDSPQAISTARDWADHVLSRFPEGNYPEALSAVMQWISIGEDVTFITLPGEPVADLAKALAEVTGHLEKTFIAGYTNGLLGYLPTDRMIIEGGYEAESSIFAYLLPSTFAVGTDQALISAAKKCREKAVQQGIPNGYGRYHLARADRKAFFVLSSGRCGTMTLAHLLDTATNARVWHHPQPDPIKESLLAYHDLIDKKDIFWKSRRSIIHRTWSDGLIHGETDLLMTPFADRIAGEIPDSKFIVLIRDPRDFVRSGMRRNYYQGHPWDCGRLRPKENSGLLESWDRLDPFGKICWLWRETYRRILNMTSRIPQERVMIVRLEDLLTGHSKSREIFTFLGLEGFDGDALDRILDEKLNAQRIGEFPRPADWPSELKERLWNECGETAKAFGYQEETVFEPESQIKNAGIESHSAVEGDLGGHLLFLEFKGTSTGGHLDHIVDSLKKTHDVKYIKTDSQETIPELIDWADTVWLEWANQMAVHVTNNIPQVRNKKVICRLHGYEVFTDFPAKINWDVVDQLIFVAKHKQEIFNRKFDIQSPPQIVIRNGINTKKFTIAPNKINTKKMVMIGHINFRKGLPMLLQFYSELIKRDPDWFLYIRGEFQDARLEMAAMTMIRELSLEDKLEFVDWVDDLNTWLSDKSHILSFSLEESFHYTIGNGMAAGLKPVIHAWNESREIWPEEFIFGDLEGFLNLAMDSRYEPERYRELVFEHGLEAADQIEAIRRILMNDTGADRSGRQPENSFQKAPLKLPPSMDSSSASFEEIRPEAFSKENAPGLLLRHDESLQDYMHLAYHLQNVENGIPPQKLLFHLQTIFHRMINTYFNALTVSQVERDNAFTLCERVSSALGIPFPLSIESPESLILSLFGLLKDHLPESRDVQRIHLNAMNNVLQSPKATPQIAALYHGLKQSFEPLYADQSLSSFMIHGSLSTLDFTPFSDVDTQIFLSDRVFSSPETLQKTAGLISGANHHLKLYDPLQHHGYFIATDLDRRAYPEAFLPLATMSKGTALWGAEDQTFALRSSDYESRFSLWHMGYYFRTSIVNREMPQNPFDLKRFLSRLSMLPVLFLELFENKFPYKRDSFEMARPSFPENVWSVFEIVTRARETWNPTRMLRFNSLFYQKVLAFSENLLERLGRLPNG